MLGCPRCGGLNEVRDSRRAPPHVARRRRECLKCGHRWSTLEIDEVLFLSPPDVAKLAEQLREMNKTMQLLYVQLRTMIKAAESVQRPTDG